MQEEHADQQVCAPDVDRTNKPAKINLGHDRADTLEGLVGSGLVIQRQQDPRGHLDAKQKQGHAAQEIEERGLVDGDVFLGRQGLRVFEPQPLEKERPYALHSRRPFRSRTFMYPGRQ